MVSQKAINKVLISQIQQLKRDIADINNFTFFDEYNEAEMNYKLDNLKQECFHKTDVCFRSLMKEIKDDRTHMKHK